MPPIIGRSTEGRDVRINVERLIVSRLLISATSGAGKSWTIRRLLEQTHGHLQQIVIDVEGDFFSLREKFDYVLAGGIDGDCPADVRCAAMLARKLLELRSVSCIIDIYELGAKDRIQFVKLFLESMINAPKSLWHPCLVVIDECQLFAPSEGKCDSTSAVADLMGRGRKRGFCGVVCTLRPAALDTNVRATALNKLIGGLSLDIDVERSGKDLGFNRNRWSELQQLKPGHFFAIGPALCDKVTEIVVGGVVTSHPKAGQQAMAPPPPREAVKKVLASLADLPQEAIKELQTIDELKARVRTLEAEVRKATPAADLQALKAQHANEIRRYQTAAKRAVEMLANVPQAIEATREFIAPIAGEGDVSVVSGGVVHGSRGDPAPIPSGLHETHTLPLTTQRNGHKRETDTSADGRILRALAMVGRPTNKRQLGVLAGVNRKKSTWRASMASLKQSGMITLSGDGIELTDAGRAASNYLPPISADERIAMWKEKFDSSANRLLNALLVNGTMSKDMLSTATGIDHRISTWRAAMAQLRAAGFLIEDSRGFSLDRDLLEG